jgi:hypothetical protein
VHLPGRAAVRCSVTATVTALVIAVSLAVAGCDVSGDIAIPRPAAAPGVVSAAATATAAETPVLATAAPASAVTGAGTCAPGLWSAIKDHIDDPAVAVVGLVDGCRLVSIATGLSSSSVSVAVAICNKAAEVAYASGVSAITVTASDTRALATGAAGSACTGQP